MALMTERRALFEAWAHDQRKRDGRRWSLDRGSICRGKYRTAYVQSAWTMWTSMGDDAHVMEEARKHWWGRDPFNGTHCRWCYAMCDGNLGVADIPHKDDCRVPAEWRNG